MDKENKTEIIEKEFALYRLREVDIEDMKLKIKELQLCDNLSSPSFDEKVQTSQSCRNNDYVMNQISSLKSKIELYEMRNKKIDNSMKLLEDYEREIIVKLLIDKKSISRTAAELFKSRKSIKKIRDRAILKIRYI